MSKKKIKVEPRKHLRKDIKTKKYKTFSLALVNTSDLSILK